MATKKLENLSYQELAKMVGKDFIGKSKEALIKILTPKEVTKKAAKTPKVVA